MFLNFFNCLFFEISTGHLGYLGNFGDSLDLTHVGPGRPGKTDQTVQFDLMAYLASKRPGVYRFLGEQEAQERLPEVIKDRPGALKLEMAKRPVQCMVCGSFLHFPRITNDNVLPLGHFEMSGEIVKKIIGPFKPTTPKIISTNPSGVNHLDGA